MSNRTMGARLAAGTLLVSTVLVTAVSSPAGADSVEPGARTCFDVAGSPGDAAVVNLTPVGALASGSGQLVSSDLAAPPVYSNVNFAPGTIDPNIAVSAIGADGQTCFVNNSPERTGIVADHMGTIDAASYTQATPSGAPARVVDTRTALGGTRLAPSARLCFAVDGTPGDAAVVNLTPVLASSRGNGQLVSSDIAAPPVYSNVNWEIGSIDPNVAIAEIGADSSVCFINNAPGSVDLIADHMGTIDTAAYTPASPTGAPVRSLDSRATASRADLVLGVSSVGAASFTRDDADTVTYVSSALGAPVSDESLTFPVPSTFGPGFETADGTLGFLFRESREVCWNNAFCATFGGPTPTDLEFVGWNQDGENPLPALRAANGVTIGSRGSDFPDGFFVPNGGCFSFAFGSTNGIGAGLVSDGVPFGEVGPTGVFTFNTPPLSDVVVIFLFSGSSVVSLEGDC